MDIDINKYQVCKIWDLVNKEYEKVSKSKERGMYGNGSCDSYNKAKLPQTMGRIVLPQDTHMKGYSTMTPNYRESVDGKDDLLSTKHADVPGSQRRH